MLITFLRQNILHAKVNRLNNSENVIPSLLEKMLVKNGIISFLAGVAISIVVFRVFMVVFKVDIQFWVCVSVIVGSILLGNFISSLAFLKLIDSVRCVFLKLLENDESGRDEIGRLYLDNDINRLHQSIKDLHESVIKNATLVAIGNVASQVAHDIRSPLSSMQAALMMLRKQCGGDKDATEFLNLLQLSSTRLEGISNGLLAKYKGEESGAQNFSIHEVLDELIGELRASPIGQGTEFVKHYHTSALYVSGDKTGVSRAIGNIIKNALEAMEKNPEDKSKKLVVGTALRNDQILINIADTGPGIPADKIPLILQGGHTEGKNGGHGIGTKVVREVVDAHKGTLNIESEIGKGTSFIITLPVANIATQDSDVTVTIPYSKSSPIRVIDDEPSMREQWRLTLKALGAEVVTHTCWEDFSNTFPPHPSPLPEGEGITTTFIVDV